MKRIPSEPTHYRNTIITKRPKIKFAKSRSLLYTSKYRILHKKARDQLLPRLFDSSFLRRTSTNHIHTYTQPSQKRAHTHLNYFANTHTSTISRIHTHTPFPYTKPSCILRDHVTSPIDKTSLRVRKTGLVPFSLVGLPRFSVSVFRLSFPYFPEKLCVSRSRSVR